MNGSGIPPNLTISFFSPIASVRFVGQQHAERSTITQRSETVSGGRRVEHADFLEFPAVRELNLMPGREEP